MNNFNEPIDLRRLTLKNGLSYPNDKELIMLVLGSGTKKMPIEYMSEEILKVICSHNPENWLEKLQSIEGVGTSKALAILAALEFGKRLSLLRKSHGLTQEQLAEKLNIIFSSFSR